VSSSPSSSVSWSRQLIKWIGEQLQAWLRDTAWKKLGHMVETSLQWQHFLLATKIIETGNEKPAKSLQMTNDDDFYL
jgi:hypothetical protein